MPLVEGVLSGDGIAETFGLCHARGACDGPTSGVPARANAAQLRFFVRLAYTGQLDPTDWAPDVGQEEPPLELFFGCAAVAKRHEVSGFLPWMIAKIRARLHAESFRLRGMEGAPHDGPPASWSSSSSTPSSSCS